MLLKRNNSSSGFAVRQPASSNQPRTYVVLGVPRGGTSFVAGALRLAGVFMGNEIDPANNEDRAFNYHNGNLSLLTSPDSKRDYLASIRRIIETRNSNHLVWGWKDPLAALYIDDILPDLVNPHFIVVTRDVIATVMRERIEASGSLAKEQETDLYLNKTRQALALYQASIEAIAKTGAPTFFVSYEKTVRNGEDFAVQLLSFVTGKRASSSKNKSAIEAIATYTRQGAISANLLDRPTPIANFGSSNDLSSFSDLPAVYQHCAKLINQKHYEEGLLLTQRVLAQIILGFDSYPNLNANPILVSEIEAGMWFMAAVAMINLGDGPKSYLALCRFSVVAQYFSITHKKSNLIDGVKKEAENLLHNLERELYMCI